MAEGWEVRGPVRRLPAPEVYVGPPFPEGEEAGTPAYELDIPEARDAEEWHSVYRDLEFVIDAGSYLVRLMEQHEHQQGQPTSVGTAAVVERALYTAALVTYTRCFATGKRGKKLDESIFSGAAAPLWEWHRYWKNTRNKHIAHSVNAFDITNSVARVAGLDTENPEIREVGLVYTFRVADSIGDIRWMVKLATYAQTIALGRMNRASKKLDKRVRGLSKAELKKLKRLQISPPMGPEAAATPRP